MLDLIKKIMGSKEADSGEKEDGRDLNLATCAILIELANADGKFNKQEQDDIIKIFKTKYGLSEKDANDLLKSSNAELEKSIDLWKFTNIINQNYSLEEKLKVIEIIWEVAYSDGKLEKHEDYLVHKLANLLRLNHKQLIDAKLKVIDSQS